MWTYLRLLILFSISFPLASSLSYCLTSTDAEQVASTYSQIFGRFTPLFANAALAPDLTVISTSINMLIDNCDPSKGPVGLNSPTYTSREAFIEGQSSQPSVPFEQLDLFFSCDTVIVRWQTQIQNQTAGADATSRPIVGMSTVRTTPAPEGNVYPYWIKTIYSETDIVAWCEALGISPGVNGTF